MTKYKVSEISPDTRFNSDVLLDSLFLLTTPPCKMTSTILSALARWSFYEIQSEDSKKIEAPKSSEDVEKIKENISTETVSVNLSEFTEETHSIPDEQIPDKYKTSEEVSLDDFGDFSESGEEHKVNSEQAEVRPDRIKKTYNETSASKFNIFTSEYSSHKAFDKKFSETINAENLAEENAKIIQVQKVYDDLITFITQVYTRYVTRNEISQNELNGKVLELCNFVRENKSFILRVLAAPETRSKNFIVSHTLRTTIFSIIIGLQLKIPYENLIELGVASVLHEIGQIRLPPQLYMNEKALTPTEKAQMQTHTVIGYNIVKTAGFPLKIQLGVLEHHERENGSGYPRHLQGKNISVYAKIIGVACSFEAITASRSFKEAKTGFEGMIEILQNKNSLYDDTIVKALLYSLSLYPIGTFVFLTNGRVGQVINISQSNPNNLIIEIIGSVNSDGSPKRVQTDGKDIKIARAMTKEESADLLKIYKPKLLKESE